MYLDSYFQTLDLFRIEPFCLLFWYVSRSECFPFFFNLTNTVCFNKFFGRNSDSSLQSVASISNFSGSFFPLYFPVFCFRFSFVPFLCPLSRALCNLSLVLCPLSSILWSTVPFSVLCLPSSFLLQSSTTRSHCPPFPCYLVFLCYWPLFICFSFSVFCPLSPVLCLLSSVSCPLSLVSYSPFSVICTLFQVSLPQFPIPFPYPSLPLSPINLFPCPLFPFHQCFVPFLLSHGRKVGKYSKALLSLHVGLPCVLPVWG